MGLWSTSSETVWKVQIKGEMQRKKINAIVDSPQNTSVMEGQCEMLSCVKAKVGVELGERFLKVSENSKVYFPSKPEEEFFLHALPRVHGFIWGCFLRYVEKSCKYKRRIKSHKTSKIR